MSSALLAPAKLIHMEEKFTGKQVLKSKTQFSGGLPEPLPVPKNICADSFTSGVFNINGSVFPNVILVGSFVFMRQGLSV